MFEQGTTIAFAPSFHCCKWPAIHRGERLRARKVRRCLWGTTCIVPGCGAVWCSLGW